MKSKTHKYLAPGSNEKTTLNPACGRGTTIATIALITADGTGQTADSATSD